MHTIGHDDPDAISTAVGLGLTSPVAWSMTPRQLAVFKQLCRLQMEDGGMHSVLPNVFDALLAVARRPWWDRDVADIPCETSPGLPV